MEQSELPSRRSRAWVYPLILVAATLICFGNAATAEFTSWDDPFNIWNNPRLNPPTVQNVAFYWTHAAHSLYIPLTYTVWALLALFARVSADAQGISLNPWVFHSANIALHTLSVLVVFRILNQLVRDRRAACIGALLFGLHPVQVEAVAWAAGLKDVLCGLFSLTAICQYLHWRAAHTPSPCTQGEGRGEGPIAHHKSQIGILKTLTLTLSRSTGRGDTSSTGREGKHAYYALATIAFVAAMLAKPSALTVPIIAFAIDRWLIRRPLRTIIAGLAPWAALSSVCAIIAASVQPAIGIPAAPLWARPLIAGDSLAFYLYKLVWPIDLAIDYGHRPAVVMRHWWFFIMWIIPLALGGWLFMNRKRRPELFVAGNIFLAGLLPVLGLVTFDFQYYSTTADHYLYVSMLGPALAGAWAITRFNRTILLVAASILLALFGVRNGLQSRTWTDNLALFSHTIDVNPDSFMAWHNLGHTYLTMNRPDLAEPALRKAVALKPDFVDAHMNLANALAARW